MFVKIFTIAFLLGLVQINKSAPADIIASYGPQIQNLQIRIGTIIHNGGQQIGLTRGQINKNVILAQRTVSAKLGEVSDAIHQAQLAGASADCVNKANNALAAINTNELNNCRENKDLDLLGVKLGDLGQVKNDLGNLANTCQQKTSDDVALAACLDQGLESASNQADQIEAEVSETCNNAVSAASACTQQISNELTAAADKVVSDLNKCIV